MAAAAGVPDDRRYVRRGLTGVGGLAVLAAPAGAEDTRTKDQRYHDALQDAIR